MVQGLLRLLMSHPGPRSERRIRPQVECMEERWVPASTTLQVPGIIPVASVRPQAGVNVAMGTGLHRGVLDASGLKVLVALL